MLSELGTGIRGRFLDVSEPVPESASCPLEKFDDGHQFGRDSDALLSSSQHLLSLASFSGPRKAFFVLVMGCDLGCSFIKTDLCVGRERKGVTHQGFPVSCLF
jgi:hypothetical protein